MRHFIHKAILCGIAAAVCVSAAGAQAADSALARAVNATAQPGDRIWLHFVGEMALSDTVVVNERGEAMFPKLGVLAVSRIPIGKLGDTLRVLYTTVMRAPDLEATVLRRIVVLGAVKNPNMYYVDVTTNLAGAVALAGGILESGKRKSVTIVRGSERIVVDKWSNEGSQTDLRSGDQIMVSRRSWISLNFLPAVSAAAVVASLGISLLR
jgi:protein involved in polysaccharide export with SLBB domain